MSATDREQQRLLALAESGLLETEDLSLFEEATQSVAEFLEVPICILSAIDRDWQWIQAEVGWSQLEQIQSLATVRQIKRSECFCSYVIESEQVLSIRDTTTHPTFAHRLFVGHYGIRAYMGVPLMTSTGYCVGTLAVMDLAPRAFRPKEIQFVKLNARLCMAELERGQPLGDAARMSPPRDPARLKPIESFADDALSTDQLKIELLDRLMQELRTPLTSVMGMTSVLSREIYGPLRQKQKEYLKVIHDSGQYLLSLVEEVLALRELNGSAPLSLTSVDVEMLCQQVLKTLEPVAERREQQIHISVEPVHRIWLLDKSKIQQLLYHLIYRVAHVAEAGCVIRVHVSRKMDSLNIVVWVSHPWLGDSLPETELEACGIGTAANLRPSNPESPELFDPSPTPEETSIVKFLDYTEQCKLDRSSDRLGLLLSCKLAQMHGGSLSIQGSGQSGYRYIVTLPERR
ncbi:MAG: GAF domain-containing sensor histidine kinase [Cyanobacteriota bacterium]|nr:GAF domain-containing sensor histidine kinase [Cyanobacteriota bacterium]